MQLYDHVGIYWKAIILFLVFNTTNKRTVYKPAVGNSIGVGMVYM